MKYDYVSLYNKNAAFFNARPMAKRALKLSNHFLTGLFFLSYGLLWVYALFIEKLDPKALLTLLFVPALAFFVVSVLRIAIDRPRPYAEDGARIEPLTQKKRADKKSFPSRHLACASVIAMAFTASLPAVGILLLILSVLLAYVRFALGLHYPSDLLAGGGVGILVGCLCFVL